VLDRQIYEYTCACDEQCAETLRRLSADPGLRRSKSSKMSRFSYSTFARARLHLPRYLFPSVQPLAPPHRLPPPITAPVTHSSVQPESSRRGANIYSHTQPPPQAEDTGDNPVVSALSIKSTVILGRSGVSSVSSDPARGGHACKAGVQTIHTASLYDKLQACEACNFGCHVPFAEIAPHALLTVRLRYVCLFGTCESEHTHSHRKYGQTCTKSRKAAGTENVLRLASFLFVSCVYQVYSMHVCCRTKSTRSTWKLTPMTLARESSLDSRVFIAASACICARVVVTCASLCR
jgi:hypothetical protein